MLETFQIIEIDVPGPNYSSAEWDRRVTNQTMVQVENIQRHNLIPM